MVSGYKMLMEPTGRSPYSVSGFWVQWCLRQALRNKCSYLQGGHRDQQSMAIQKACLLDRSPRSYKLRVFELSSGVLFVQTHLVTDSLLINTELTYYVRRIFRV